MAKLVSVFISSAYRQAMAALVWVTVFLLAVALAGGYALHKTAELTRMEGDRAVEQFTRLRANLLGTFDLMQAQLTAEPCSPAFREQLRRIAFLPDGLNEFLYAPGGEARCSLNIEAFEPAVDLGAPDMAGSEEHPFSVWIDRDLGFLGLVGEQGALVLNEPFIAVVPPQKADFHPPHWLSMELVMHAGKGEWLHRGGTPGLHQAWLEAPEFSGVPSGRIGTLSCDKGGVHCVVAEASIGAVLKSGPGAVAMALLAAMLIATFVAGKICRAVTRYWSFEARFCRRLDAGSIVCAYQPVMRLDTGEISGCEVLARWRDINGETVFPDRFIELVKRRGLTMRLTSLVAQRALEELEATIPEGRRLQVSVNIFPQDLDSTKLLDVFSGFVARPDRFDLILEIIESDEMPESAQREIEVLRRAGVKTYIDDFGAGYSNMHNLAGLSVDGVKLDRSFAMAPDNSMMAQMLHHAVDMVEATGRVMVVEGVETAERLALLRRMRARIDFVQGYFIARPLDITAFAAFLAEQATASAGRDTVAAMQRRLRDHIHGGKIAI